MKFFKHSVSGNSIINITGNSVMIDGQKIDTDGLDMNKPDLIIKIESDLIFDLDVKSDKQLVICGDVRGNVKCNNISCDDIGGSVVAGGSVNCDDIGSYVESGGSVNCDNIKGDVKADGSVNCDIIHGKVM